MGAALAKFRKPNTTYEVLENLEMKIKTIEEYSLDTKLKQRRYVGNFVKISIAVYLGLLLIFYFQFFPPTLIERITYLIPLLLIPFLIIIIKKIFGWYFQRKLDRNSKHLRQLRNEKKKLLEQVMEKETYKVAIEILNKFGDKTNGIKSVGVITPRSKGINQSTLAVPQKQQYPGNQNKQLTPLSPSLHSPLSISSYSINQQDQRSNDSQLLLENSLKDSQTSLGIKRPVKVNTPFPIINQSQQGIIEKILDFLIGEGPYNRYAMICSQCHGHNGMALPEEFEYSVFRCVYCNYFNPPRKTRPTAPKLELTPVMALDSKELDNKEETGSSNSSSSSIDENESEYETNKEVNSDIDPKINDDDYETFTQGIQKETDNKENIDCTDEVVNKEKSCDEKKNE